jgi:hypothetical protein
MVVKMKRGTTPVSARLTIKGIVHWAYLLSSPDHTFKKSGISDAVNDMDLGVPSDLHLDPHEWTIHVANLTPSKVNFDVLLEFMQANTVLEQWSRKGALDSGGESVPEDKAVLIIDPASV